MDQFRGLQCEFERFPLDQRCRVPLVGNGRGVCRPARRLGSTAGLPDRLGNHRLVHAGPAGHAPHVLRAQDPVGDGSDHRCCGPQGVGSAFRAVEVEPIDLGPDHELDQRNAATHEISDRLVAGGDAQVARIHPLTGHRHEGLPDELLVHVERAQSGLASRLVGVEREDDLAAVFVLIQQQATQHLDMLFAERGATGGHRSIDPGQVAGHHVGVALHDDDLLAAGDLLTGKVHAVQDLRLVVHRRLGSVQVLRSVVVGHDPAGAEADDLAGQVADRPHDPAPETVVGSTVAAQREPGGDHFVIREARGAQALDQVVPAWQREPHCEHVSGLGIQVTLREELPGRLRLW